MGLRLFQDFVAFAAITITILLKDMVLSRTLADVLSCQPAGTCSTFITLLTRGYRKREKKNYGEYKFFHSKPVLTIQM